MLLLFIIMVIVLVSSYKEKSLGDLDKLLYLDEDSVEAVEDSPVEVPELSDVLDSEEVVGNIDDLKREASELLNMINE